MPPIYEKKDVGIATRVPDSVKRRLDEIADEHDRKPAYVIRELLLRGLALYEIDGKLRGEAPLAEPKPYLAPVVARIERGDITKKEVQQMIDSDQVNEIERRLKPRKTQKVAVGRRAKA